MKVDLEVKQLSLTKDIIGGEVCGQFSKTLLVRRGEFASDLRDRRRSFLSLGNASHEAGRCDGGLYKKPDLP